MLLAIDISNTNIKFGLYNDATMKHHWVVSTARQRTTDEYAMVLNDLLRHAGYSLNNIDDIIMSSVVPPLTPVFQDLAMHYCKKEAFVISHNLADVFEVVDRVIVLRLGRRVGTFDIKTTTPEQIVSAITGAEFGQLMTTNGTTQDNDLVGGK